MVDWMNLGMKFLLFSIPVQTVFRAVKNVGCWYELTTGKCSVNLLLCLASFMVISLLIFLAKAVVSLNVATAPNAVSFRHGWITLVWWGTCFCRTTSVHRSRNRWLNSFRRDACLKRLKSSYYLQEFLVGATATTTLKLEESIHWYILM